MEITPGLGVPAVQPRQARSQVEETLGAPSSVHGRTSYYSQLPVVVHYAGTGDRGQRDDVVEGVSVAAPGYFAKR